MLTLFAIAFVGGFLTIAAPCILAVLPIIFGATMGQQSKLRPFFIVLGLTVSFTAFGVIFQYVSTLFGLSNNTLRNIALVFLAIFGLALIFPTIFEKIIFQLQNFYNKIFPPKLSIVLNPRAQQKRGLLNGFFVGASLGLVWVPCAGPILGAILTLAVAQSDITRVILLMLAYSLGAGLPMLLIAYGGNFMLERLKFLKQKGMLIQQISGVVLLLGVVFIALGFDTKISVGLAGLFPDFSQVEQNLVGTSGIIHPNGALVSSPQASTQQLSLSSSDAKLMINKLLLPKGTKAPELTGTQAWINSPPLTLAQLKGKVVIVDFWTYSCINCIRTLPYLSTWYEKYKDEGLVIIGVHTPEFGFERDLANVQKAVKDLGIQYPVVQDNNYSTWNAYNNEYWPAKYVIDKDGDLRYMHFGEGNYDGIEMIIQDLLDEQGGNVAVGKISQVNVPPENLGQIGTPEIYLGYNRQEYFGNTDKYTNDLPFNFTGPTAFHDNLFYLSGEWTINGEYITNTKTPVKLYMDYQANKINLVADKTDKPVVAKLYLDGQPLPQKDFGKDVAADGTVTINKATLYNLVDTGSDYGRHTLMIEVTTPGIKAFTFTFG